MFHSVEIGQSSGLTTRGDRSRDQAFPAFVSSDDDLVGLVAFALHERQFAEWRAEMARACGRPPTEEEIHAHRLGETTPRPQGRRRGSSLDAHEVFIVGMIEARKDITLNEMVERLAAERSMRIGRSALSDWLRGHGWTFKKRPRMHWSRTGPTS